MSSRPPMHPLVKLLIVAVLALAAYVSLMFLIAYVRFSDIKGKMEEAALNASAESDSTIADKLAENALTDKLPIAGDYFFQVRDETGKIFLLKPETDAQQREYRALATRYFLSNISRGAGGAFTITLAYDQPVYFPFRIYTHTINFRHEESTPQNR